MDGTVTGRQDRTTQLAPVGGRRINSVVSFGEDTRGELYIADYDGEVYKIVPARSMREAARPPLAREARSA